MKKYSTIIQKAKQCKNSVEKNKKLGISHKWGKIFADSILNPKQNIEHKNIGAAPKPHGDNFKDRITKDEYIHMCKELNTFVKANGRMKNFLLVKRNNKNVRIRTRDYVFLFARVLVYYSRYGKLPKDIGCNSSIFDKPCTSPYISQPHYLSSGAGLLGQINSSNCGPHSVRQCLKKFGIDISESTLASWAGTVIGSGTDHSGLETAIAKAAKQSGVKLTVQWMSFKNLGNSLNERMKKLGEILCQKNKAAFTHIGYQCSGECSSGTIFGHYECLDQINLETKNVRALNSLGSRDGNGYYGHLQYRSFDLEAHYISQISQMGICIITKE